MKLLKQILAAMTMILMFLAVPVSAEEAEGTAYAIFEESTGTLTFKRTAPGEAVPTAEAAGVDNVYTGFENSQYSSFSYVPWYSNQTKIMAVHSEVQIHPKSTSYWFQDAYQLQDISGLKLLDTSGVTQMKYMFACYHYNGPMNLSDLSPISNWNTSAVTNMSYLFYNTGISDVSPLSSWNTSAVTNMSCLFSGCTNLSDLSSLSKWNTSAVTDMSFMFNSCTGLKEITELSNWNTERVTSFHAIFASCLNLERLDLKNWAVNQNITYANTNLVQGDNKLSSITLGEGFSFRSMSGVIHTTLPNPPANDKHYTGLWCREDEPEKGLTAKELAETWDGSTMAGTWIWQKAPEDYTIKFDANGGEGSMADVTGSIFKNTILPESSFYRFDHEFTGWSLSAAGGTVHRPGDSVALSGTAGSTVTLYAQWKQKDNKAKPEDGWYEFTLKGDEEAVFKNLPTESPYSVYEQTPDGWVLVESSGEQGTVRPNEEAIAAFKNKAAPDSVNVQLTASKLLNGKSPEGEAFQFELLENGEVIDTVSSSADGTILFKQISYVQEGSHTYTIRETGLDGDVYEANSESYTVTVNVTKNAEGKLEAAVTYPEGGVVFHNTTIVHEGSLTVSKKVEGTTVADQDFTFQLHLTNADGTVYTESVQGAFGDRLQSLKDGDTFQLKAGGAVLFTVPDGVSYSVTEIDIPDGYTVTQDTFSGTIHKGENAVAAFENTYNSKPVSVLLQAEKTLSGGDLSEEKYRFTFELLDADGSVVSTADNTTDGAVLFDELTFDAPGEYHYTIREIRGDLTDVQYDETSSPVTVHVTDPGNGQITASVEYEDGQRPVFLNQVLPGSLSIIKTVEKGTDYVKDAEFTFTLSLKDQSGDPLSGSWNWTSSTEEKSGTIEDGGTLVLKAGETITIADLPAGTQYSFEEIPVEGFELTLSENTAGTIQGNTEAKVSFTNTYRVSEEPLLLEVSKTLTGADLAEGQFTFQLKDENGTVIQEAKNDATGKVAFAPIPVSADSIGKTLKYTVSEVNDSQSFIAYDGKTLEISVLVKDDGKGHMEFEITYPENAVFENTYEYSAAGKLDLRARKVLQDGELKDGQFSFELLEKKDGQETVIQTVSNNAAGEILFDSISYTLADAGTHTYIVREKKDPKLDNVAYDQTEYTVTVTVRDNGDGTLLVTADKKAEDLVFTNIWQEPTEMLSTGQSGIRGMTVTGLGILAASAFVIEERRRRTH